MHICTSYCTYVYFSYAYFLEVEPYVFPPLSFIQFYLYCVTIPFSLHVYSGLCYCVICMLLQQKNFPSRITAASGQWRLPMLRYITFCHTFTTLSASCGSMVSTLSKSISDKEVLMLLQGKVRTLLCLAVSDFRY